MSSIWQPILLRLAAAIAMAALGAFAAVGFKKISHWGLCVLISFAAGALLAVAVLDLIPETFELAGLAGGIVSIASGYLLFALITRFVFHICPACSATHTEVNFKAISVPMVTALSVHSFMDGLAIYSGHMAVQEIGILVPLAVGFHKLPEGLALTLVARESGMRRRNAFLFCLGLEGGTTLAGGLSGYFIFLQPGHWEGYVFGHVAGGFIFLVVHALFSEFFKHHPRLTVTAALCGAFFVALTGFLIGAF